MTKPRVLFITPLPPPVHGSAMMSQYIKDSKLINEAFDCDFVNLSTSRRMDEIGRMSVAKIFRFAGSYVKVMGRLMTRRYDLCYLAITCHGVGFLKDAPFVLMCKMAGRKVVIHQHNKGMSRDVDKPIYRWLLPLVYRNAKVILLSWKLYPDIEKVVKREQVVVCPNGIPETLSEEPSAERHNKVPHLLFLSNLLVSKGVFVLLDACKILKEKGYSFVCEFVGGETAEIDAKRFDEEVKERGLNEIAVYEGRKFGSDKDVFLDNADIFVFPTSYPNECFPLVLLEAMEHSLPCVSTSEGGIIDIVEDGTTGYIVPKNDAEALAGRLVHLIDHPEERMTMGRKGREKFERDFTLGRFEENLLIAIKCEL